MLRIALIAHDNKKDSMVELVGKFAEELRDCLLVATGKTGALLKKHYDLDIKRVMSGPLGGDQQVGAMVAGGKLDAVIFLRDPLTAQPHEPDITALMRVCDVHDIPLATNNASGMLILKDFLSRNR